MRFLRPRLVSGMARRTIPLAARFWSRVSVGRGTKACWPWRGGLNSAGYGQITVSSARGCVPAHRVAYELTFGVLLGSKDAHHTCENRVCCNPFPLLPLARREHLLNHTPRSVVAMNKAKTVCKYGHDLRLAYVSREGYRRCRLCEARRRRECSARKASP